MGAEGNFKVELEFTMIKVEGWQVDSTGKAACHQARQPEIDHWDPHGRRERNHFLKLSSDLHTHHMAHACPHTYVNTFEHTQAHTNIHRKERKGEREGEKREKEGREGEGRK